MRACMCACVHACGPDLRRDIERSGNFEVLCSDCLVDLQNKIVMAHISTAYIIMADISMACIVMACA